ncbi:zinc ribbon domain-containing protein, partial [Psychromonas sp.]|uniref:zinc ribbon domain-containing protein n=1 Tax=Psychromonas sp. TaxID=1884585 RepID=UPI00356B0E72
SKTCHCCGHKVESMPLSVRKWDCPNCGTTDIDRDLNAALNIRAKGILKLKAAGQVVTVCGGLRKSCHEQVAA